MIRFVQIGRTSPRPPPAEDIQFLLRRDHWNDYSFETLFGAEVLFDDGSVSDLGHLKIIKFGQTVEGSTSDLLSQQFSELPEDFCSLGQGRSFYEKLFDLGPDFCEEYLRKANDVAYNVGIRQRFEKEEAFQTSLLRSASDVEVLQTVASLFGGLMTNARKFQVRTRIGDAASDHVIDFDFSTNEGGLPHRIAVMVGKNGVGKTTLMARIAMLVSRYESKNQRKERQSRKESLTSLGLIDPRPSIYNTIAISFNAFDDFEIPEIGESETYRYVYSGFRASLGLVRDGVVASDRIVLAISQMDEEQLRNLIDLIGAVIFPLANNLPTRGNVGEIYAQMSAGQRIMLNVLCDVVLNIRKNSLLLIDEPETHLHPQLLSAFLLTLDSLLETWDSFAIIATHSPIVVQQIPSRSVKVIRRNEDVPTISSPIIECFGENLTEIVRAVFDANEGDRSYEDVIDRLLEENDFNEERVLEIFERRLGMNAAIYLSSRAKRK